MLKYLELQNVGPAPHLRIEFGERLNLITGDNGLGKSFLLDVAWWALTRKWPHDVNALLTSGYPAKPAKPDQDAFISFEVSGKSKESSYASSYVPREGWVGKPGRPWNPGLVIYAHADGGFSVWDPARNYWKTDKNGEDIPARVPAYVFSAQQVWDGLVVDIDSKPTVVCNGLIRDWASWIREDGEDAKRMAIVLKKLSPSAKPHDVLLPGPLTRPFQNDVRDVPSLRMPYGDNVPVVHASSGVRRIIALAYMLLWTWREHVIAANSLGEERTRQVTLLVDEVESHLHPRWQRRILSAILSLARLQHSRADIQLIAATHSPLVLASAEPIFQPETDGWFDLDLSSSDGKAVVALEKRPFVPHGDASNWLTSEAFNLPTARNEKAEAAILRAMELLRSKSVTRAALDKANKELHEAGLPDIDPFWVRWGAFYESKKAKRGTTTKVKK